MAKLQINGGIQTPPPTPESALRWYQYITMTFPYMLTSWRWINGAFLVIYQHRAYRYIATIWTQVITWLNTREGWHFMKATEQYQLLKWVQSRMANRSIVVTNFNEDWKDGVALCALIDDLVPGTCPRHDLLHPKQERLNIELGLRLAEMHLGVISDITPGEILGMNEETEKKFQRLIARLRSAFPLRHNSLMTSPTDDFSPVSERNVKTASCFAKGMGLLMGVQGKKARFNIYLHTNECMDIVIELEGMTNQDYCTERITVRSPRKKESTAGLVIPSVPEETSDTGFGELTTGRTINIPLEYEVLNGQIAVNYTPPSNGRYKLSIISRGRHIFGSPFVISVDEAPVAPNLQTVVSGADQLVFPSSGHRFLAVGPNRRDSDIGQLDAGDGSTVLLGSDTPNVENCRPYGEITSRKLLRSIVFRNGERLVLEGDDPLPQDPKAWSACPKMYSLDESDDEIGFGQGLADSKSTMDTIYLLPSTGSADGTCPIESTRLNVLGERSSFESMVPRSISRSSFGSELTADPARRHSVGEGDTLDDLIEEYRKIAELFQGMKDEKFSNHDSTSDYDSMQDKDGAAADEMNLNGLGYEAIGADCEPRNIVVDAKRKFERCYESSVLVATNSTQTANGKEHGYDISNGKAASENGGQICYQMISPSRVAAVTRTSTCRKNLAEEMERVENSNTYTKDTRNSDQGKHNTIPRISKNILPKTCTRAEFIAIANGLTNQRVPDALISDWVTLWNVEGEGIVKTRVKEWEKTLNISEENSSYSKLIRAECLPLAKVVTGQVQSIRRSLSEEMRKSRSAEAINNCNSLESIFSQSNDRKRIGLKRTTSSTVNGDTKLIL